MDQSIRLVDAVKKALKHRGIAYRDLAASLELSESAIKQMFASGNCTLKRLDELCEILGMDFAELAAMSPEGREALQQLSVEQEERHHHAPGHTPVAICSLRHPRKTHQTLTGRTIISH